MIAFKIMLIILVAAPVIGFAFFLWYQIEEYVRRRNKIETQNDPSKRKRRRKK